MAKFKIGDIVKTIVQGSGLGDCDLGLIVKIVKIGKYCENVGYCVKPKIGNSLSGFFEGMIDELSFELSKAPTWKERYNKWILNQAIK